jgi:hypothetical protein
MRPALVVIVDPVRDFGPGMIEAEAQALVEKLVAHAPVETLAEGVLYRLSRCDEMPDEPVVPRPGEQAVEVNSVPLSETIMPGLPCRSINAVSSRATRRPEIEVSGIAARHSRVTSSTMLRIRNRRPQANWSWTKSRNQWMFAAASTGIGDRVPNVRRHNAEEISALAAKSDPKRPAPIFLPHLQGERVPLWDIAARALFAGLDASTGASVPVRSVLEGIAYSARLLLGALEASSAVAATGLRHAGGGPALACGAKSGPTSWGARSIGSRTSLGVVGAAALARTAAHVFGSVEEAANRMAHIERTFEPDAAVRGYYDEGFGRYTDLYARLKGFGGGASASPVRP